MAHRHKKASGGGVKPKRDGDKEEYDGKGSHLMSEAKSTKNKKEGGRVQGRASGGRLDKRARGGGVGSDKSPFSSAHVKGGEGPASNPAPHSGGK